jgi:hypothetical protein
VQIPAIVRTLPFGEILDAMWLFNHKFERALFEFKGPGNGTSPA